MTYPSIVSVFGISEAWSAENRAVQLSVNTLKCSYGSKLETAFYPYAIMKAIAIKNWRLEKAQDGGSTKGFCGSQKIVP